MKFDDLNEATVALEQLRNDPEIKELVNETWRLLKDITYTIADSILDGLTNLSGKRAKLYSEMFKHLTKQGFTRQEAIKLILKEDKAGCKIVESFVKETLTKSRVNITERQTANLAKDISKICDLLSNLSEATAKLAQKVAMLEQMIQMEIKTKKILQ